MLSQSDVRNFVPFPIGFVVSSHFEAWNQLTYNKGTNLANIVWLLFSSPNFGDLCRSFHLFNKFIQNELIYSVTDKVTRKYSWRHAWHFGNKYTRIVTCLELHVTLACILRSQSLYHVIEFLSYSLSATPLAARVHFSECFTILNIQIQYTYP